MNTPDYCIKEGIPCAFRMAFAGGPGGSACGYAYFTDEIRGCSAGKCDKWADELPEGIKDESNTDDDISDSDNSAECAGGDNVLYSEGLEERAVLDLCSGA